MQLADKLVEGLEAAQQESRQREDIEAMGDEQLPEPIVEAMQDQAIERRNQLMGAVRMILDGQHLNIGMMKLPKRELLALEALQVAVSGKSSDIGQFVYASDRRDILERALGVLQPDLSHANLGIAGVLEANFDDLTARVADLRDQLSDLEDAQDELLDGTQKDALKAQASGDGDKADKPSDPDAPRPPSTLAAGGPEAPVYAAGPSALATGGPEAAPSDAPTTLTGPELPAAPDAPSTLAAGGPDAPARPDAPTTLGDPADIERAATPWWRRPFGA